MRVGAIGTGRRRPNFESVDAFCDTLDYPFLGMLHRELGHLKRQIRPILGTASANQKASLVETSTVHKANWAFHLIRAKLDLIWTQMHLISCRQVSEKLAILGFISSN